MHPAVHRFLADCARKIQPRNAVEIGARNVNGSARDHFSCSWHGVDIEPGDGVDEVRDYSSTGCPLDMVERFDLAVSTETFEHSETWRGLFDFMVDAVKPGGHLIVTCATTGRAPHSAVDGGPVRDGEFYANVEWDALEHPRVRWLTSEVDLSAGDLLAFGVKW